ncbi:MAG: hypothetical protein CM15mP45_01500 [Deltaproteobacteria bacterium]|nr:MAG: hypothetical protein CM15mP45_01500 [Deltaproteobacteria bacterium]
MIGLPPRKGICAGDRYGHEPSPIIPSLVSSGIPELKNIGTFDFSPIPILESSTSYSGKCRQGNPRSAIVRVDG